MTSRPLELHFGRFRDLTGPLAEQIAASVRERSDAGGLAALIREPVEVVVPSRAVADALATELLARRPAGVAGVELRTPEALARLLLNRAGAFPRVATESEQRLAMAAAAAAARPPLRAVDGLAPLLLRTWRDLRDSDRTIADLTRAARGSADRERAAALADVWKRYEASLRNIGALDPADLFRAAIDALSRGAATITPQIVFGFYDVTGIQEKLLFSIHRAAGIASLWIPVPLSGGRIDSEHAFARRLVDSLSRLERGEAREPEPADHTAAGEPAWSIEAFPTQIHEVRGILGRIRALLEQGVTPDAVAIVARSIDPRLAGIVEREAESIGVAISRRRGRPLASHPWGRAVRDLLRLRPERFHREILIELAAAPFRKGVLPDGIRAADLDDAARRGEIAGGTSAAIRAALPRLEGRREEPRVRLLAAAVERFESLSRGADQPRRGAVWAEWLEEIAASLRVDALEDLEALDALQTIADDLRTADRFGATLHPERISAMIASAPDLVPPAAPAPAVWFGDLMSARGLSFEHVFAIAMQQEIFPQRRSEDVLLSNRERRAAGIREIEDGRLEEKLLFRLLGASARNTIHYSWSATDGARKTFRPSMFLKQLALESESDPAGRAKIVARFGDWVAERRLPAPAAESAAGLRARAFLTGSAGGERLVRQLRLAAGTGQHSPFDGFLPRGELLDRVVRGRLAASSPGRLEAFGTCPHRFYLQTLLRIEEVEEPEWELQMTLRKKGVLAHEILERFYRSLPEEEIAPMEGALRLPPSLRDRLAGFVEEAFRAYEAQYATLNPLLRRIERRLTLRHLEEFLVADLGELATSGYRPWLFELSFGLAPDGGVPAIEPVRLPIEAADVRIRGRIDRVDRIPDGSRIRVVDYKGGRGARFAKMGEKIERGHALQLALYALAARQIFEMPADRIDAAIKPLRSDDDSARFSFNLGSVSEGLERSLELFAGSMLEGRFPPFVAPVKEDHCRWCVAAAWCRTRHTGEERWATRKLLVASNLLERLAAEASPP